MGKLTATAVKAAKSAGRFGDGGGLYLLVKPSGTRSWVVRVQKSGKRRDIGLGSADTVSLAMARDRALKVRTQVEAGLDPIVERLRSKGIPTFRQAAASVCAEQRDGWRNAKHAAQWLSSLERHAFPAIGDIAVDALETGQVRDLLAAMWLVTPETARRVRQRIGQVVDWAVAKGYRDNSLPWPVINRALPKVAKVKEHFEAMPFADVPGFMERLKSKRVTASTLALQLLVLTASRSGEVRLADWSEFDLAARLWHRPAERMKSGRPHTVPLSKAALAVLDAAASLSGGRTGLVFQGGRRGAPLSDMTLTKRLRDMGLSCTAHGFRSSFRDWVSETTDFDGDVAEAALAHVVKNATEAAYRRGDLLEKRRGMMDAWAGYCVGDKAPALRVVG